jgi:hypothetical protein
MDDGCYLYCAVPDGHSPTGDLRGIDNAVVRAVSTADLAVWISPLPRPPMPSVEAIQRHNAVIEAAMTAAVTPVPFRFGQFVGSLSALAARVAERSGEWRAQLEAFAGHEEYGVRVLDPAIEPAVRDVHPAPVSGRAYLETLARAAGDERHRRTRAEVIASELKTRLGGLVVQQRVEPLPSAHGLATIAHLVRHEDAAAYRDALDSARASMPALRFLSSGPWPPYSFAG